MAKVKVHAGDWATGSEHSFSFGSFSLRGHGKWFAETVRADRLVSLEVASEENVKRLGGAAGWGAVGALALGPVGLLAGVVMGGNKKDVTFVAEFDDGRKMLATTDSKAFTQMQAAVFDQTHRSQAPSQATRSISSTSELEPLENPLSHSGGSNAYQESAADRASRAKYMRDTMAGLLTPEEGDRYEALFREGQDEQAHAYFLQCLEDQGVRVTMEVNGFTEEEARHYRSIILDDANKKEAAAMRKAARERRKAEAAGVGGG